jgi:hypothetical protein
VSQGARKELQARSVILIAALLVTACPGLVPGSKSYSPSTGEEREVLANARRDIFPDDVRGDLDTHRSTLIAWVGILESARWLDPSEPIAEFMIEHHYWDWIEDHSVQREVAFLSPRGEGRFVCAKRSNESKRGDPLPANRSMAIVYGYPDAVRASTGVVELRCVLISFAPREWYGTDIWDYGRDYLLNGDKSDFKVLRVPF